MTDQDAMNLRDGDVVVDDTGEQFTVASHHGTHLRHGIDNHGRTVTRVFVRYGNAATMPNLLVTRQAQLLRVVDEIVVHVVPPTVPTTASPFHATATHVDALGMPVAFGSYEGETWSYHPTPCCGAAASISDGPMYCKACYAEVDDAYGNVPVEPIRPI